MAIVPLRGFGNGGVITDIPPQEVPANGVSRAENVVFRGGAVSKAPGYELLRTNPEGFAPRNFTYWLQPWRYAGSQRLAMFKETGVAVLDGNTVTVAGLRDQTNTAMTLTASQSWQSDLFGAFVVATNGVDAPIFSWNADTSLPDGSRFMTIPGWGGSNSPGGAVKAIRSFKNFLFAIGVASDPYSVYWSDPAPVDSFPQSWDYASTTTLAGFSILQSSDGLPVDGCVLGDSMIVYTRGATYAATFRPGDTTFPFDFRRLWPWGCLGTDCVVQFENRHFVVADGAIYVHDGVTNTRVASRKVERQLFREMSDLSKVKVTAHLQANEIWVYYASGGPHMDRACVWNWVNDTWTFRTLPSATCIVPSQLIVPQLTYDGSGTRSYDSFVERYDDLGATDGRIALICASGPGGPLDIVSFVSVDGGLVRLERGAVNIDVALTQYYSWIERTGIDLDEVIGGVARSRFIRGVYPQIRGTGTVAVQIGAAETANSPYFWDTAEPLDLDSVDSYKVDTRLTGRYLGFRVGSWEGAPLVGTWEFTGLDLDVSDGGR